MDAWGRTLRSRYRDEIQACRRTIDEILSTQRGSEVSMLVEAKMRLSNLLAQEEAFWKQRAKVFWLRDGDTNSRFFHAMASAKRRRRNIISKLIRDDGGEVTE